MRCGGFQDRPAAGRTRLLPLQPTAEAAKVEEVAAGELLGGAHLLPTDYAHPVRPAQVLLGCVGVALVHVRRGLSVAYNVFDAHNKGADGEVEVADNVQRNSIVHDDDCEKYRVDQQLERVHDKIIVEEEH